MCSWEVWSENRVFGTSRVVVEFVRKELKECIYSVWNQGTRTKATSHNFGLTALHPLYVGRVKSHSSCSSAALRRAIWGRVGSNDSLEQNGCSPALRRAGVEPFCLLNFLKFQICPKLLLSLPKCPWKPRNLHKLILKVKYLVFTRKKDTKEQETGLH